MRFADGLRLGRPRDGLSRKYRRCRAPVVDGRRSATTGTQDDIGDVRGAGRGVDPRLDRVQLDREVVAEQPAEVVGTYVVGRVDAAGLHMLAVLVVDVVVDGEQQATRT